MKSLGGGTNIYCPRYGFVRECRVPSDLGLEKSGNHYFLGSSGETYFQRNRECMTCGHFFETIEVWSSSPNFHSQSGWRELQDKVQKLERELSVIAKDIDSKLSDLENDDENIGNVNKSLDVPAHRLFPTKAELEAIKISREGVPGRIITGPRLFPTKAELEALRKKADLDE